jgi:signal transduction histidine kinase
MEITRGYSARMYCSSLQAILDTGMPRIINDLEEYLAEKPDSESTQRIVREGMRSSLTCPLIALNKPVGFLFFSSMEKGTYRELHGDTFLHIATQLSVIVEKSRLYQELLELSDLKTRFLGMAAHDLRNPLCVVRAYSRLLLDDQTDALKPDQSSALSLIDRACDAMVNMVETFLDISAIESGQLKLKPERVLLHPYLEELQRNARLLARAKNIRFRVEVMADVVDWVFDPHRINQVLHNLISNALKYSDAGTETVLRAAHSEGKLEFAVCDQGRGIPEEDISKLFKEYGQTSVRPTAGESSIGLGLAICRRIVDVHGGSLMVESAPGRGSTFTVLLP